MKLWPFNRKSHEQALVEFAGFHVLCNVRRDADDRPFVLICGNAIRLDDPAVIEQRNVIWIKRRADEPPADKRQSVTKKPHLGEVGYVFRDVGPASPEEIAAQGAFSGPEDETNEAQCNGNCFLVGGPLGCRARCGLW